MRGDQEQKWKKNEKKRKEEVISVQLALVYFFTFTYSLLGVMILAFSQSLGIHEFVGKFNIHPPEQFALYNCVYC